MLITKNYGVATTIKLAQIEGKEMPTGSYLKISKSIYNFHRKIIFPGE